MVWNQQFNRWARHQSQHLPILKFWHVQEMGHSFHSLSAADTLTVLPRKGRCCPLGKLFIGYVRAFCWKRACWDNHTQCFMQWEEWTIRWPEMLSSIVWQHCVAAFTWSQLKCCTEQVWHWMSKLSQFALWTVCGGHAQGTTWLLYTAWWIF